MAESDSVVSSTEIDNAGRLLSDWVTGKIDGDLDQYPLDAASRVVAGYRMSFTRPALKVEEQLAALVSLLVPSAELTGRPKRAGAIVGKLVRFPTMRLTQMADIAGLRVKFPNGPQEVRRLCTRISEDWPAARVMDYVHKPKRTGYRAIHVLVPANSRIVEVQLRTARQNRWADEVESAADRLGFPLKDGEGPAELVRYFERAAYKLAVEEQGSTVDEHFKHDFENLRRQVRHYFA